MDKKELLKELENYVYNAISNLNLHNSKLFCESLMQLPVSGDANDENCDSIFILKVNGGLNGRGQFLFYLEDVAKLVKRLMCRFADVWLIRWENDAPDDVFYLEIGLSL